MRCDQIIFAVPSKIRLTSGKRSLIKKADVGAENFSIFIRNPVVLISLVELSPNCLRLPSRSKVTGRLALTRLDSLLSGISIGFKIIFKLAHKPADVNYYNTLQMPIICYNRNHSKGFYGESTTKFKANAE